MKELVSIQVQNDRQLVSARDLHKALGSRRKFSNWWEQVAKYFEENTDFTREPKSYLVKVNNGATKKLDDYVITIDMAKELCMLSRTKNGQKVRRYFIEVERKWNDPTAIIERGYQLLKNKNFELTLKVKNQGKQLKLQQPKVDYYDKQMDNPALMNITTIAKGFGWSGQRMNNWLHKHRVIYRQGGQWVLYSKYQDKGYADSMPYPYVKQDGTHGVANALKWTQKGKKFIYDLMKKNGHELLVERDA